MIPSGPRSDSVMGQDSPMTVMTSNYRSMRQESLPRILKLLQLTKNKKFDTGPGCQVSPRRAAVDPSRSQFTKSTIPETEYAASTLHTKAWGKKWPQSKGEISEGEIDDGETGSVDDEETSSVDEDEDETASVDEEDEDETASIDEEDEDETGPVDALSDKLEVPSTFDYLYLEEIRSLKSALGANSGQEEEDFLVVREEYVLLRQALERLKKRAIVVTGHPGIGSYESWF
jgi:hypothetical protein